MRKVYAWLGAATLFMLMSRAEAANDVLKPYVVMILDTSGSMAATTGSGPTSCGKRDTRLNHAVCAINSIVNSYGEIVFSLGRFRESTNGTVGAGQQCDANGDQEGNFGNGTNGTLPIPSGGDVCNTQGPYCGDCDPSTGSLKACSAGSPCTSPNTCVNGFCVDTNDFSCKNGATPGDPFFSDSEFEVLTALVDGNNAQAAEYTDGGCSTCSVGATALATADPEIWGISRHTFTPLSSSLAGAQRYWEGALISTDTQQVPIWPAADPANPTQNNPGYDPINRDPAAHVFLTKTGNSGVANIIGSGVCNPGDSCDPSAGCVGGNCCCVEQCRPYITILLTDGAETCTTSANTLTATSNLADNVQPRNDIMPIATAARAGNVVTLTTPAAPTLPHPFKVGDQIRVTGTGIAQFLGTFIVTAVPNDRTLQYQTLTSGTIGTITNSGGTTTFAGVGHTATSYNYNVQVIPIGFGIPPGDPAIEAIAHSGGAFDTPNANEGYYAQDEADLELAISQILADSVRAETCNDRDDDCDTRIDEDFTPPNGQKGNVCTVGVGACIRSGTFICSAGGLSCSATAGTPTQEICNSIDDDCDGFIDETTERGAECANATNDDIDTVGGTGAARVNDGCPVGPDNSAETACNDAIDSDSDGLINDGCPGVGSCTSCVPTAEICDGADNDCDTVADQTCRCTGGTNAGAVCTSPGANPTCSGAGGNCTCTPITRPCGIGVCAGTQQCIGPNTYSTCTATSSPEICDGLDNDCDGVCDGFTLDCSDVLTPGGPGSDNPGSPQHVPAPTIPQNICRPGTKTCPQKANCSAGNAFSSCSGEVKPCGPDVPPDNDPNTGCDGCSGLDDDCDNVIDEDFTPADCSTNCGIGTTVCQNGQIVCNSQAATNDPTCNNVDDDCDGKFDENWVPSSPTCGTRPTCDSSPNCVGFNCCVCNGVPKCVNGAVVCDGGPINPDVCNCLDDDCDGAIDEDPDPNMTGNQICPNNGQCVSCQCAFGCAEGEFPCPLGKKCEVSTNPPGEFCVNDPCFNVTCPAVNGNLQTCTPKPNFPNEPQCVDVCSLINNSDNGDGYPQCAPGQVCVGSLGECRPDDCTTFPDRCTAGQTCIASSTGGLAQCVSNPCAGVTCDSGKYCLGGECVASCADVNCPTGQRCRQGACETDPCGGPCPFGQACNDSTGKCIEDPCKFRDCPQGQWCNPNANTCEDDPCVTSAITCPNAGEVCRGGTCLDPDTLQVDAAGESHVTVGGGGGCNTSGSGNGILLALGALGLFITRRRRTVGGAL